MPATSCPICGRPVQQPKRGYQLYHPQCRDLHLDLDRLRRHLDKIEAGEHPASLSQKVLDELRYELFALSTQVPRRRDKGGRFASSGVSAEYDKAREARAERAAMVMEDERTP